MARGYTFGGDPELDMDGSVNGGKGREGVLPAPTITDEQIDRHL